MIRTIRTKPVSSTAQQARGGSCTGHLEAWERNGLPEFFAGRAVSSRARFVNSSATGHTASCQSRQRVNGVARRSRGVLHRAAPGKTWPCTSTGGLPVHD